MAYNIHNIKVRRSYSIGEITSLFGISRKTCSRWINKCGLKAVEVNVSPLLIMGADLREFIIKRKTKRKAKLKNDEFYCFKCRKPVKAKAGSEGAVKTGKKIGKNEREQLQKTGVCQFCNTRLKRFS
jgi:predicted transcriptional regulator